MEQKTKQKVQSIQFYVDTINSAMYEYLSLAVNKSQLAGTVIRLFGFIGTSSTALSEQPIYPTCFSSFRQHLAKRECTLLLTT